MAPRSAAAGGGSRGWVLSVRRRHRGAPGAWREIPLVGDTVTLGASRACAVVLEGREVAGRHATLQLSGEDALLSVAPDAPPAMLHGLAVQRAGLAPGDSFRLGDTQLMLRRTAAPPATGNGGRHGSSSPASFAGRSDEPPPRELAGGRPPELAFLEGLIRWSLHGPAAQRGEMLAEVCRRLGAEAGCAFTSAPTGRIAAVAAWGDALAGLDEDELAAAVRRAATDETRVERGSGWMMAGFRTAGAGGFGVLLRGSGLSAATGELLPVVARLFAHDWLREKASGVRSTRRPSPGSLNFPADVMVGQSRAMRRLYEQLATVVGGDLPVLVLGETGVGKEHVAQLIHDSSPRRDGSFVSINCAAIPAELLEAELFGIERGVATGVSERAGKFREAHRGTLLLDEIGELPLALQAKLLRVLEEKKVQPVGGQAAAVDLRIVAATNQRLEEVARRGGFRLDLYYRLAGFVVEVPPLRQRGEDVPLLFDHFLRQAQVGTVALTPGALAALVAHPWPGNVRELRHEAARIAARLPADGVVDVADLSFVRDGAAGSGTAETGMLTERTLDEELRRIEASLITATLRATNGNLSQAARRLGTSRSRLYRRLRELGFEG
ncbi:MAG TPA: sigma 54-interacting transcriptional regulator [Thermoanaerobaculia bacterium]|jgi:DNA-binding NtrC family response regulator|nr:sigma 54-interacting transcriptional regulator [Thermoanaerobaculia bacterium]